MNEDREAFCKKEARPKAGVCRMVNLMAEQETGYQCFAALWFANVVPAFDFADLDEDLVASVFAALLILPP